MTWNNAQELKRRRKLWTDLLRSGDYKQSQGALECNGAFCCLGIACLAYEKDTGDVLFRTIQHPTKPNIDNDYMVEQLEGSTPPAKVRDWLQLKSPYGYYDNGELHNRYTSLVEQNDEVELDFNQIADIIDSNPPGMFYGC